MVIWEGESASAVFRDRRDSVALEKVAETVERALEQAGRTSDPVGRASVPAE